LDSSRAQGLVLEGFILGAIASLNRMAVTVLPELILESMTFSEAGAAAATAAAGSGPDDRELGVRETGGAAAGAAAGAGDNARGRVSVAPLRSAIVHHIERVPCSFDLLGFTLTPRVLVTVLLSALGALLPVVARSAVG
jgi:hypothetical protein